MESIRSFGPSRQCREARTAVRRLLSTQTTVERRVGGPHEARATAHRLRAVPEPAAAAPEPARRVQRPAAAFALAVGLITITAYWSMSACLSRRFAARKATEGGCRLFASPFAAPSSVGQ